MDSSNPSGDGEDAPFYDASDDFPFYDCADPDPPPGDPSPVPSATLRRRRLSRDSRRNELRANRLSSDRDLAGSAAGSGGGKEESSAATTTAKGEAIRDPPESTKSARAATSLDEQTQGSSVITEVDSGVLVGDSVDSVSATGRTEAPPSSSVLISLVELLIKAIGLQFSLLISMLTFPFWCLYTSFMFVMDPFSMMRRGRAYIAWKMSHLCSLMWECVSPFVNQWFKEHESVWKLMSRFGWGLFWAIYVCSILFGLLIAATLFTGLVMRSLVVEPLRIEDKLNFDYTEHRPVAYVPVVSCAGVDSGVKIKELTQIRSKQQSRIIPPNHKLEAAVILTLPESEYNKNLGIFQIRVDFLSSEGQKLASSSRPCMLLFKSEPIRLMLTMLKIAPLIAGYISEAQTVKVKFHGFTEGHMPTSCLRVLIEQRAEFQPGGGIPEIYDATLVLQSELPFLRRLLWSWRKTVFIWTIMVSFTMELLLVLICCRPVILPRTKRSGSTGNNAAPARDNYRERP